MPGAVACDECDDYWPPLPSREVVMKHIATLKRSAVKRGRLPDAIDGFAGFMVAGFADQFRNTSWLCYLVNGNAVYTDMWINVYRDGSMAFDDERPVPARPKNFGCPDKVLGA